MATRVAQEILTDNQQTVAKQTETSWWSTRKVEILLGAVATIGGAAALAVTVAAASVLWPLAAAVLSLGLAIFTHGYFFNAPTSGDPQSLGATHDIQPLQEVAETPGESAEPIQTHLRRPHPVNWPLDCVDEVYQEQFSTEPFDPESSPYLESAVHQVLLDAASLDERAFRADMQSLEQNYPNNVPAVAKGVLDVLDRLPDTLTRRERSTLRRIKYYAQRYLPRGMPIRPFTPSKVETLPKALAEAKPVEKTELTGADKLQAASNAVQWGLVAAANLGIGATVAPYIALGATVGSTIATYCMLPKDTDIVRKAMTMGTPFVMNEIYKLNPYLRGASQLHSLYTQARNSAPKLQNAVKEFSSDPLNAIKNGAVHIFNLAYCRERRSCQFKTDCNPARAA